MNEYHVAWLKGELPALVEKHIISQESADSMTAYYAAQVQAEKDALQKQVAAQKSANARRLPIVLSVIAAVLIAGGIISLIAYNWAAISRAAKSVTAIALLVGVQGAGIFLRATGRTQAARTRECISLLWALLFGAVVAFISQIYRFPSNAAGFTLVWAVSSVVLTYAFRAHSTFVLSLVQIFSYLIAGWDENLFCVYALFFALVPLVVQKTTAEWKRYVLLFFGVALLYPMLARFDCNAILFVVYASLSVLFILSKKKPLQFIGVILLMLLAIVLMSHSVSPVFSSGAVSFFRSSETVLSASVASAIFLSSIGVPLYQWRCKKESAGLLLLLALSVAAVNVFCIVPVPVTLLAKVILPIVLACLFVLFAWKEKRPLAWAFFSLLAFSLWKAYAYDSVLWVIAALVVLSCGVSLVRDNFFSLSENRFVVFVSRAVMVIFTLAVTLELSFGNGGIAGCPTDANLAYSSGVLGAIALFGVACLILSARKNLQSLFPAADVFANLLALLVLWALASSGLIGDSATYTLLHALIIADAAFGAGAWLLCGKKSYGVYVLSAAVQFFILSAQLVFDESYGTFGVLFFFALIALVLHLFGRLTDNKPLGVVSAIVAMLSHHLCPLHEIIEYLDGDGNLWVYYAYVCLFSAIALLLAVKLIRSKRAFNLALFALPPLIFCALLSFEYWTLPFAALFSLYYFYRAYKLHSAALANCTAIYVALVLCIRFFILGYGLVAQGITLILLGVFILAINRVLARSKQENAKTEGEH